MALQRDTVAIPVAKGINVNTPARLVDAQELLEAQNVRFPAGVGAKKRRGHNGQRVRGAKPLPPSWTAPNFTKPTKYAPYDTSDRYYDQQFLPGYGYLQSTDIAAPRADFTVALDTSVHPDPGYLFGTASRDNELLTWNGTCLFSKTNLPLDGGRFSEFNAVMPALHSEPFAKANVAQNTPDVADNGVLRVAVWVSGTRAYYSVFDSVTGTLITGPSLLDPIGVTGVRAMPVEGYIHLFITSTGLGTLELRTISNSAPTVYNARSLGDCNGYFDVHKVEAFNLIFVAMSRTTTVHIFGMYTDSSAWQSLDYVTGLTNCTSVAVAWSAATSYIGLTWRDTGFVYARCFDLSGTAAGSLYSWAVSSNTRAVAVSSKVLVGTQAGQDIAFNFYYDDWDGTKSTLYLKRVTVWYLAGYNSAQPYSAQAYHLFIGSAGFRCGDRSYIWAARNSTYQSKWLILDESLKPIGGAEYISAATPSGSTLAYTNFSVNWMGKQLFETTELRHRMVFHCGLSTRVRVEAPVSTAGQNAPAVYTEPYIKFCKLDFLPPLRSAQAGRCTYFAGAQLWSYDGAELTESNFHFGPENVAVAGSATPGALVSTGQYIYRIDLCYRNAQNEEIRSASFYTAQTVLAGQTSIQLTIPTTLTRRDNAYLLIYRNEDHGTVWYMCNSRDPVSPLYLRNDQTQAFVTYTDSTVSDAALISREQHPNQSFEHLDPFAAPACEIIAAGRDRVWLAGGEIPFGQVMPSRLFDTGEVPAFHGNLVVQVDRSAEPITGIGFVGEYAVFFRQTQTYILDNHGPDNESGGAWNDVRDSEIKMGAVSQESIASANGGIFFQSPAGIRQFAGGGGLVPVGNNIDVISDDYTIVASVVVSKDQEVRFYTWEGTTLVYNYQYGVWTTWTVEAAGAVRDPSTNLAFVAKPTGEVWSEAEGVWTDNTRPYRMRVRFAWLRAGGLLDFQQVRRIGALGSGSSAVHVEVFYNEREFAEEWFDFNAPDLTTQNNDTFGTGNFGDGNFGDDQSTSGIRMRDITWPWRRRLFRRKCSVISIAIDDNYTNGEGFTLTALALELAKKPGLDRMPWRGGTYNNTGGNGSSETGN